MFIPVYCLFYARVQYSNGKAKDGTTIMSQSMYIITAFIFCIIVLGENLEESKIWDRENFGARQIVENITLEELVNRRVVGWRQNACIRGANNHMGRFEFVNESDQSATYIAGTTFWLNQWMYISHAMFDLHLIQVLRSTKLNRVIMQRTLCNHAICFHFHTWNLWFRGFYTAAVLAAGYKYLPFYIREYGNETHWKPHVVGYREKSLETRIPAKHILCFENFLYTIGHNFSSIGDITTKAVLDFKNASYSMLKHSPNDLLSTNITSIPIYITVFDRSEARQRAIVNPHHLISFLSSSFPAPNYVVQLKNAYDFLTFEDMLFAIAETTVAISLQGGFMTNAIFMRPQSLIIGLHSNHSSDLDAYAVMAHDFFVYYRNLTLSEFNHKGQQNITITTTEYESIKTIILTYLNFIFDGSAPK